MHLKVLLFALGAISLVAAPSKSFPGSDIAVVRAPNGGIQPEALMDDGGTLHLIYYIGDAGHGDLFYVKSSDSGATWSAPLRVNSQAGTAIAAGTIRGGEIAIGKKRPCSRGLEWII